MEVGNTTTRIRLSGLKKLSETAVQAAVLTVLGAAAVHAQTPQTSTLPTAINESGTVGSVQGISSGLNFLFYNPAAKPDAPSFGPQAPTTCGVTEDLNILAPGESTAGGLGLTGAALYSIPSSGPSNAAEKQAIDQTLSYKHGALGLSVGYLDVGKLFAANTSSSSPLVPGIASKLTGEKGQNGFNTGLDYSQSGTKFGLQLSSVADSIQNQHRLSETLSMERDFDKSLSLAFQRTQNNSEQLANSASSHMTTDVLHLAYSPTRTGFLLDAKNTSSFSDQGAQTNDLLLKVAQRFSALNLTSQFESSSSKAAESGATSAWLSQRFDANQTLRPGLTFSGYWAKKTVQSGTDTDDFDVIIKSNETRYLEIAAEYAKHDASDTSGTGKQSLVASITPGSLGILGPLLLNLSINNQQSQMLDGLTTYGASLSGQIAPTKAFDFGLTGAKYVLAYTEASAGGTYAANGHSTSHSARTLRIVSAPAGKNGLSWTVSQQQRLDQNGQPLRTASDYDAKYAVNTRVAVAASTSFEGGKSVTNFTDQDQRGVDIDWNQSKSIAMIAQYVHSRSASQNIAGNDGYFLTYSAGAPGSKKMDLGIGEQTKRDLNGQLAYGTTANVAYALKTDDDNLLNVSSKLTDWRNHGFNNDYARSVEATGQIDFKRLF